jgi:predicted NBD/HSP70 family sugar kinase
MRVVDRHPRRRGIAAERDNLALTVSLVRSGAARTRQEVQRVSGLGRAVVAERVATLIERGLLKEEGLAASTGGRAPRRLSFDATAGYVLAATLGTTTLGVGVTDLVGRLMIEHHEPADIGLGANKTVGRVIELFQWMLSRFSPAGEAWAVSLALPSFVGPSVDRDGSVTTSQRMPGWTGVPFQSRLSDTFGTPVFIGNEVQLMALGELRHRRDDHAGDLIFVKVGTGISAGLCADGRIHQGSAGYAGDIGHVVVDVDSDVICRCGNTGCLEALAGGAAIARDGAIAASTGRSPILAEVVRSRAVVTAADVGWAANRSDPASVELISRSGRLVGETMATLVAGYNPSRIIVGGGVAESGPVFFAALRDGIYRRSRSVTTANLSIVTAELGKTAGLIGGASAALDGIFARDRLTSWIDAGTPRSSVGRDAGATSVGRPSPGGRDDGDESDAAGRPTGMPASASPALQIT